MSNIFFTPNEVSLNIASNLRGKRLLQNLSQASLSRVSGVSYGVIKKFEITGKISLESLLKIAMALGCLGECFELFKIKDIENIQTIDELINKKIRKRGRK